jgi:hypothetical protein
MLQPRKPGDGSKKVKVAFVWDRLLKAIHDPVTEHIEGQSEGHR